MGNALRELAVPAAASASQQALTVALRSALQASLPGASALVSEHVVWALAQSPA
jgi:hypothetical protein